MARIALVFFISVSLFCTVAASPGWSQEPGFFRPEGLTPGRETTSYSTHLPQNPRVALDSTSTKRAEPVAGGQTSEASRLSGSNEPVSATPERIPLAQPEKSKEKTPPAARSFWGAIVSMFGSLIFVVGIFLLIVYGLKRISPNQNATLPPRVIQCLGQYALTGRNRLYLLRLGKKLLLLSVSGDATSLICEIEDEEEVASLLVGLGKSESNSPVSGRNA